MGIEVSGLAGLLILVADIWAIINVVQSPNGIGSKVLWIVLVLILPLLGFLLWLVAGPRAPASK